MILVERTDRASMGGNAKNVSADVQASSANLMELNCQRAAGGKKLR